MDCFSEYFLADLGSTYNHIWKNLTMVRKTVENQPPGRLKFFLENRLPEFNHSL